MNNRFQKHLASQLEEIKDAGLYKHERCIESKQDVVIKVLGGKEVLNFCANNYLGLSSHPRVINAAAKTLDEYGFGMSSVRFICGTQSIHQQLEARISNFFGTEDTILYAACFDANGGVFEPLLDEHDVIISDELNHASIIDGVRLCKAQRRRYKHADMVDLEEQLMASKDSRFKLIVTDGVFSMDGDIAPLDTVYLLAKKYDALIMVDDSHAAGFIGATGRGTPEYYHLHGKIDIVTGTLGKALGGAMGGYTTGSKEIIGVLRQRSRPYLFSNSLAPSIVGGTIEVFNILEESTALRDKIVANVAYFKDKIQQLGFDIKPSNSGIIALMLYDSLLAQTFAAKLLDEGIYVIGFYYPVVPKGKARIRIQISAAHNKEHLDQAIIAFTKIGKELKVI